MLSNAQIDDIVSGKIPLSALTSAEKQRIIDLLDEKTQRLQADTAKIDLIPFAHAVYPGYSVGAHHKRMAELFKAVANGTKKRIIINVPPRFGKSEMASYLFPAWFLGQKPDAKIIMATHTASLSEDFGRRVRNLINTPEYQRIFPGTQLSGDSKSAGAWNTSVGGKYYAVGVGGALAGRGADLLVIDDPHSEQDARSGTKTVFDQAWMWYQTGPRQRLMWGGAIIVVQTRWSPVDLSGRLLEYQSRNPDADQWEVIEFPAILPSGKSLWPEKWPVEELLKTKATLDAQYWNAQYQQQPTSEEAAIIKREMWREWADEKPPLCTFILQSWDTAHESKTTADFSACTTWGLFINENDGDTMHIILLDAFKGRYEFPELKKRALEAYKEWEPDICIIEKKAAGAPLIQELRRAGIPISEYSPSRGNDKTVRINAVADVFASGKVWAPAKRWARDVIEEMAAYPQGEHDDLADTCLAGDTPVLMADGTEKEIRLVREGDFVQTPMGAQRVTLAACTGVKEIWELKHSIGVLRGTANHPIWANGQWVELAKTQPMMYTRTYTTGVKRWINQKKKWLYSMVGAITDTQKVITQRTVDILGALGHYYTGMFGSTIMGIFLQHTTSTIKTATLRIMSSVIWSAYQLRITWSTINQTVLQTAVGQSAWNNLDPYKIKLRNGTDPKLGEHGIGSMRKTQSGKKGLLNHSANVRWLEHVSGVVRNLVGKVCGKLYALLNARQPSVGLGSVKSVKCTHIMQPVFNISVDKAECYFASGVLVHNCTQAILRFRQGGFIPLPVDEQDEPNTFRHRAAYY